jgi:DNA-binding NtrC family response regulator
LDILLADDEKTILIPLRDDLLAAGHRVDAVSDGKAALEKVGERNYDCVITDIRMPDVDGLTLLKAVKERSSGTEVLIITGHGTIEAAREAFKKGAFDFILKPFLNEDILVTLDKIGQMQQLRSENLELRRRIESDAEIESIVGRSPRMEDVLRVVRTVAPTDSNILIEGESGTGKERIAKAIHQLSQRSARPLVVISCAALPATLLEDELFGHERGAFTDAKRQKIGRFEKANAGTVFLDDIDDMDLHLQVKLLRVLQEREFERLGGEETIQVDVRVITATKLNLEQAVAEGKFREDLYYRLNVVPINLPPLRDREGDVPLLVKHFLEKYAKGREFKIRAEDLEAMSRYPWPGNVRELENSVERAIAMTGDATYLKREYLLRPPADLRKAYAHVKEVCTLEEARREAEIDAIHRALKATKGHKAKAAELLGISRKNLWEKMREYEVEGDAGS